MIYPTTGKPSEGMSLDLRNPAQSSPARVGLAASPAQSVQGSTLSPYPWIPAHVAAARSMAICIGANQRIQRAWPFKVAGDEARASAAPHAPKALAPATVPPVGNTGGTHIRSETRV